MKRASIALRPSTIIPPAPLPFVLSEFFRQRRHALEGSVNWAKEGLT